MKRFFILCLISCALFSCSESSDIGTTNNNGNKPAKPVDKITIDIDKLDVEAYSDPIITKFNATNDWKAYTLNDSKDWIKIEPESGVAGDAEIKITIAPNNGYESRESNIYISTETTAKSIKVYQGDIISMLPALDPTYESSDFTKNLKRFTMQEATEGNGLDLVFMGDAFADSRIKDGSYRKTMMYAMEMFFSLEPYKSFRHLFNCYYVNVISKTESFENKGTALETVFGEGTVVTGNEQTIIGIAHDVVGEDKMDKTSIIVIVNSQTRHGTCAMYSPEKSSDYGNGINIGWNTLNDIWNIIPHECGGHGFGKLADEYVNESIGITDDVIEVDSLYYRPWGWYKNVDFTDDPDKVKWSHFLSDSRYDGEDIGIFEGAHYCQYGAYRPSNQSMMNGSQDGDIFNAPSREAIYYRIHKLAYGDEWEYDYEKFVEWDAINRGVKTRTQSTDYVTKKERLAPPIIVNKSWREVLAE